MVAVDHIPGHSQARRFDRLAHRRRKQTRVGGIAQFLTPHVLTRIIWMVGVVAFRPRLHTLIDPTLAGVRGDRRAIQGVDEPPQFLMRALIGVVAGVEHEGHRRSGDRAGRGGVERGHEPTEDLHLQRLLRSEVAAEEHLIDPGHGVQPRGSLGIDDMHIAHVPEVEQRAAHRGAGRRRFPAENVHPGQGGFPRRRHQFHIPTRASFANRAHQRGLDVSRNGRRRNGTGH